MERPRLEVAVERSRASANGQRNALLLNHFALGLLSSKVKLGTASVPAVPMAVPHFRPFEACPVLSFNASAFLLVRFARTFIQTIISTQVLVNTHDPATI